MQVKEALKKYISEKTSKGEVIHLTKVKGQVGKIEMTIGSGNGSGTNRRYTIWEYTKACRSGQVAVAKSDEILRRNCLDLLVPSELAVWQAKQAVEESGCHPLLTETVILLAQAQNKVSDYVDQIKTNEQNSSERDSL